MIVYGACLILKQHPALGLRYSNTEVLLNKKLFRDKANQNIHMHKLENGKS